jgi:hypothetical protein
MDDIEWNKLRIIIVKLAHNGVVAGLNPARPTTILFFIKITLLTLSKHIAVTPYKPRCICK